MSKDDHYVRVQQLTEEALERLSLLTPSLTDFILHYWAEIQDAGTRHLSDQERTSLVNLSFFYFLGTCLDFLFFLHLRHRHVNIYEHELEHILSVMITHAKMQQEAFAHDHAHDDRAPHLAGESGHQQNTSVPLNLADFEQAVRRLKNKAGDGDPQ